MVISSRLACLLWHLSLRPIHRPIPIFRTQFALCVAYAIPPYPHSSPSPNHHYPPLLFFIFKLTIPHHHYRQIASAPVRFDQPVLVLFLRPILRAATGEVYEQSSRRGGGLIRGRGARFPNGFWVYNASSCCALMVCIEWDDARERGRGLRTQKSRFFCCGPKTKKLEDGDGAKSRGGNQIVKTSTVQPEASKQRN
ncbi:hypothetical protein P152DRAFT_72225 [Eremomyces bilateralis CBS 781.70]|uniref:Uncharacterized protein n=1 Tax=Eremomyces bilateralis CBS 781.70 TaxID=1392243 RepID=A0A6G1FZ18_9PEZI|nr:uncharacterized protein P152DRAFT_72225 [Eremomyces bilateralis CBS 781.70]KAF1810941.1 hypothetical protein P152DRAFT_72225 [Eremomyces bilateralis CBS 781.70]